MRIIASFGVDFSHIDVEARPTHDEPGYEVRRGGLNSPKMSLRTAASGGPAPRAAARRPQASCGIADGVVVRSCASKKIRQSLYRRRFITLARLDARVAVGRLGMVQLVCQCDRAAAFSKSAPLSGSTAGHLMSTAVALWSQKEATVHTDTALSRRTGS